MNGSNSQTPNRGIVKAKNISSEFNISNFKNGATSTERLKLKKAGE